MPKPYPVEFRTRAVALVRAGKPVSAVAGDLAISASCLQSWLRQDRIDRGEIQGVPRAESAELRRARLSCGHRRLYRGDRVAARYDHRGRGSS